MLAPIAAADETTPSTTTAPTTTTEPGEHDDGAAHDDRSPAARAEADPARRHDRRVARRRAHEGVEARELVEQRFGKPITLVVSPNKKMRVTPEELGADAYVAKAVTTAVRVRSEGFKVPLTVDVANGKLKRFLGDLAKRTDREPVDASLTLRNFVPVAHPSEPGRRLMQTVAARQVSLAIRKHERSLELPFQELDPKVTDADLGKVIVIKRGSNQLLYYNGDKLKRTFRVATGQSSYPTPLGNYEIVTMQRNPWWYPPEGSAWAEGAERRSRRARGTRSERGGWASRRRTSGSTGRRTPPRSGTPPRTAASGC